jgi:hypothetical protein
MTKKMIYKIKFVVNEYRQDKRTGAIDPIPRSKYMQQLFKEEEQRLK